MGTEMSLFDSPWHIIILLVVVLVLFGSRRLPGAAQSLGQSMHIFKRSMRGLNDDDDQPDASTAYSQATFMPQTGQQPGPQDQQRQGQQWVAPPPQQLPTPQPQTGDPVQRAQIDDLQRQIADLQRLSAAGNSAGAPVSDTPPSTQSN
jgi:sec-independent protein translocase protein TatA